MSLDEEWMTRSRRIYNKWVTLSKEVNYRSWENTIYKDIAIINVSFPNVWNDRLIRIIIKKRTGVIKTRKIVNENNREILIKFLRAYLNGKWRSMIMSLWNEIKDEAWLIFDW